MSNTVQRHSQYQQLRPEARLEKDRESHSSLSVVVQNVTSRIMQGVTQGEEKNTETN